MTPAQLKEFLSKKNLTQEEFSSKVGITGRTLRHWYKRKKLTLFMLNAIKGAFGCR